MKAFTWAIVATVIICGALLLLQVSEGADLSYPPYPTDCDLLVVKTAEKCIIWSYDYNYGNLKEELAADGIKIEHDGSEPSVYGGQAILYRANYYRQMFGWNEAPPRWRVLEEFGKVPDFAKECYQ